MKVLIGCECSGVIRRAFRARGHIAWSCDLKPAEDGGEHFCRDIFEIIGLGCPVPGLRVRVRFEPWDLLIVHPECRFVCGSGIHWNARRPGRQVKTAEAVEFVRKLWRADIRRLCLENPVGILNSAIKELPNPQYIQPYEFGDNASKKTGLWLRGLPPLRLDPRLFVPPRMVCKCGFTYHFESVRCPNCGAVKALARPRWANQTDSGQNKLAPSATRAADRARTYPGIARAMAEQWG